jgi:hypothetical protein
MNRWFAPPVVFWGAERAPKTPQNNLIGFWGELSVNLNGFRSLSFAVPGFHLVCSYKLIIFLSLIAGYRDFVGKGDCGLHQESPENLWVEFPLRVIDLNLRVYQRVTHRADE